MAAGANVAIVDIIIEACPEFGGKVHDEVGTVRVYMVHVRYMYGLAEENIGSRKPISIDWP